MENLKIKGIVRIYEGKKERLLKEFDNFFLYEGKMGLLTLLSGTFENARKYSHLVIGDGEKEVVITDRKLVNEQFKKEITDSYVEADSDGFSLFVETYIESGEANDFHWKEVGLVASNEAGTVEKLYNRARIDLDKNSGSAVTVSWEVKIL